MIPAAAAKFAEDVELKFLGHARQLGGAGRIENDLERTHGQRFKV